MGHGSESAGRTRQKAAGRQLRESEETMATTFRNTLFGRRIAACALSAAPILFAGICGFAPSNVALAGTAAPADESNGLLALDQSMESLVARVTPSVVNITASWRADRRETADDENQFDDSPGRYFGPGSPFGRGFAPPIERNPRPEKGLGSGIIISSDGYILTNDHVVEGASSIRVTTSDRDVYPAKLVGADALTDLAVIKIDARGLSFLSWGDSAKLKPGQMVLAFGNPYGFSFSVTRGIISALNRPNPTADRYKPGQYIQTDAAINQGNSGGPLVDAKGQVVGINSFVISPTGAFSGMGFAIPAEIARPISEKLAREGKIVHGFMGISINDVTPENVQFFGLGKAIGALVNSVLPNSPGEKAGLKSGDVITGLNGDPVSNAGELQMGVVVRQPGETIRLRVMRAGESVDIPVTLEPINGDTDRATAQGKASREVWGLGLSDLTPEIRRQIDLPLGIAGAVVRTVRSGSPAENAGLAPGDVITSVNRKPTGTSAEVAQELSNVPSGEDVLVLVWSNGAQTFRVLHPWEG